MAPRLLETLETIADFLKWQQAFARIQGFLTDLEGYRLMQLAANGGGLGAIVEIGSFFGRSTAFLATGSKLAGRERVFAIDHFRGSPEHQAGQRNENAVLAAEGTTFHRFESNLRDLGIADYVTPIVASSDEAIRDWKDPIRLLFIDGDHSYKASRQDFELWSPFVVSQGFICFHDIPGWPGVTKFYEELLATSDYRQIGAVQSLRVVARNIAKFNYANKA